MTVIDAQKQGVINPLLSSPLLSSSGLGWKGIVIERHSILPREFPQVATNHHIVEFTLGRHPFHGERPDRMGQYRPYSKPPEAINVFSDGIRPAVRSFTRIECILGGLDRDFVSQVAAELDSHPHEQLHEQSAIQDEVSGGLLRFLEIEARSAKQANRLYVDHLAYALTLRLLSLGSGSEQHEQNRKLPKGALPLYKLRRVVERMKAELTADLDLETLAAEAGYSRYHFLRMFRAATSCTPYRYFLRLRIEKAQSIMRNNSLRMIDIAEACGFSTQNQFARVFRQIHGVTPTEYRRDIS
jgi:AraC family transcriptional regulator